MSSTRSIHLKSLAYASFALVGFGIGCGDAQQSAAPDAGIDLDASTSDRFDIRALYDLATLTNVDSVSLVFGTDQTTVVNGRRVRAIEYGYEGRPGFPQTGTRVAERAVLFVEVDNSGAPLSDFSSMAVMMTREGTAPDGYGPGCALETGVPCVMAGRVVSPGSLSPAYSSEHGPVGDTVSDSNELLFNLLEEMRRGTDVGGNTLVSPPARRSYITHIAEAGVLAITAAGKAIVETGLSSEAPERVVIGGHSKWGGAAAQVAAIDDRVVGAVTFGFPGDWKRFVDLSEQRWRGQLGVDLFTLLCSAAIDCTWSATTMKQFFDSTITEPELCDGTPCFGTGEDWLRQIDIRGLRKKGWHQAVRFALVRNGREGHPVDTESEMADSFPDQFMFAPTAGHSLSPETHQAFWRHWVRHSLADAPTISVAAPTLIRTGAELAIELTLTVPSGTSLSVAAVDFFDSAQSEFGPLDGIGGFVSDGAWQTSALTVSGATLSGTILSDSTQQTAVVVSLLFDDGSGDPVLVTSPVVVVPAASAAIDKF